MNTVDQNACATTTCTQVATKKSIYCAACDTLFGDYSTMLSSHSATEWEPITPAEVDTT